VNSRRLFDLLDRVADRKGRSVRPLWYDRAYSYESGRQPGPSDCHRPKDVLASVQALERELQRNSHKYPTEWSFLVPQEDGTQTTVKNLDAYYRGKRCHIFGDEKGCWARELDTPLAFPIHYELTQQADVVVRRQPDGQDVRVLIHRTSFLAVHSDLIAAMKRTCLAALASQGMLLTLDG